MNEIESFDKDKKVAIVDNIDLKEKLSSESPSSPDQNKATLEIAIKNTNLPHFTSKTSSQSSSSEYRCWEASGIDMSY